MDANDSRLSFISLERGPQNGDAVVTDCWWAVHPERGLVMFQRTSPQCNTNEVISRRITEMYPWAEVRFIEVAYVPHNCNDYAQ